jgi:hypothetical protein
VINDEWVLLMPPKPLGWWLLVVTSDGLVKLGEEDDHAKATGFPFRSEEEAVRQAKLFMSPGDHVHLVTVFGNGKMTLTKIKP